MEYRTLGKTGLRVSAMGFGGIPIQRIDEEGTRALIHRLAENGVNYIDSARGYTVSEQYLGYALEGIRDKFILATKSMSRTKDAMAKDIDISLANFRTGYIDLYQVHNPTPEALAQVSAPGGAVEAMLEAKAAGKIGHLGVTVHSVTVFEQVLELDWVETIMFPYNIVETQGEELMRKCKEKNIGFICMKPLAGGAIEDPALAMRFVAANENISVVIPGMADPTELDQNLAAFNDRSPITEAEKAKMEAIRTQLGNDFCRRCNYCAPCTVGIGISGIFVLEGYLKRYGLHSWAQARYDALPAKASDCIECGVCETRCPYRLPIREKMKQLARDFEGK
ncbi:MAG: aldo/keto reductase [Oscillospiraceae bacterium]|nr:aldo/keto reductase [Oscillospiraceae bacterium]